MSPPPQSLLLDGTGASPGISRRWARAVLSELGAPQLAETAALGLTELVTNACLHARTAITVTVARTSYSRIRFEVSDGSPVLPAEAHRGAEATTGRGLRLVAACGRWGIRPAGDGNGKTVWFEPADDMGADAESAAWAAEVESLL